MRRVVAMVGAVAMAVVACGGGARVDITDAWARTSANMQNAGAVYMTIAGGELDDALTGVSVDGSVAATAELHETTMEADGTMMMQELPSIAVPAGGDVLLEPGGYHVMLLQLTDPLVAGDEFVMTLRFAEAGEIEVAVTVQDG
jgi:copper(I)-binding protein